MNERKDKMSLPKVEPQAVLRARKLGAELFDAQLNEGFGSSELQERLYASSRNGLKPFRDKIWEGYLEKSAANNHRDQSG
jgi:hypothetical protein